MERLLERARQSKESLLSLGSKAGDLENYTSSRPTLIFAAAAANPLEVHHESLTYDDRIAEPVAELS